MISDRIRVLVIIGQNGVGGAERQLVHLVKYRDRERFEYAVAVLNPRDGDTIDDLLLDAGATVVHATSSSALRRVYSLVRLTRRLQAQVIHSWSSYSNPYAGLAGRISRVPVRLGSMRNEPGSMTAPRRALSMGWVSWRLVDTIVVNSSVAAARLRSFGVPESRLRHVANGVELLPESGRSVARDALAAYGIVGDDPVVANVGNLRPWKNHLLFVDVMGMVIGAVPTARGVMIGRALPGDESIRDGIQRRVGELGLSGRVQLLEGISHASRLMPAFSVLVHTSITEGMPNVVLEAMAARVPVVAMRVGDLDTVIVNGENGFLVERGDVNGLASAILRLLDDAALARSIGERGRQTVARRFGCERMAREIEAVYAESLEGPI
ncbi:MAG: glycosyltransferase [Acidobacteriota bacterium]